MKKMIMSAVMCVALMASASVMAQDAAKKEGCCKQKTECKKESAKACSKDQKSCKKDGATSATKACKK